MKEILGILILNIIPLGMLLGSFTWFLKRAKTAPVEKKWINAFKTLMFVFFIVMMTAIAGSLILELYETGASIIYFIIALVIFIGAFFWGLHISRIEGRGILEKKGK